MKLKRVQIREFRSIWDSNPFEVDRVACLVGKNESGKTSLLHALHRLNPIDEGPNSFDVTDDYPRSEVEEYEQAVERKQRRHATIVEATFELEEAELQAIETEYGSDVLKEPTVVVSKGYARDKNGKCTLFVDVPIVESALVSNLVQNFELPDTVKAKAGAPKTLSLLAEHLETLRAEQKQVVAAAEEKAGELQDEAEKAAALEHSKTLAESEQAKALRGRVGELLKHKNLGLYIWSTFLLPHFPKFLYFDEYYQMTGHDNIEALKKRQEGKQLRPSDHPLLGLIALARLDLEKLLSPSRTQELKNKLQGASNYLTNQIMKYWSQNRHLRMQFDVRPGLSGDPEGMQTGTNIWGEVFDSTHRVSTSLGTRSAGFVWFFSFLAWYAAERKKTHRSCYYSTSPGSHSTARRKGICFATSKLRS